MRVQARPAACIHSATSDVETCAGHPDKDRNLARAEAADTRSWDRYAGDYQRDKKPRSAAKEALEGVKETFSGMKETLTGAKEVTPRSFRLCNPAAPCLLLHPFHSLHTSHDY